MTIPIAENIYWVGTNDRKIELFEALWPLPHGISYNAYLILDEKTALIDAVKKGFENDFMERIGSLLKNGKKIDYLVINHIEPDHSGAIESLSARFPEMCIVGNEKTIGLLQGFYKVTNPVRIVKEKETLALGRHTLEFYLTPMVHWPETMMTYEQKTGTLFSGDVFGGFGALTDKIFDDEVNLKFYIEETRRYFTNVIGKYSIPVQKALAKVVSLPVKTVASTHGPVYRKDPKRIMDLYGAWSRHETEPGAVVVYASMYGHTKKMAEAVKRGLLEGGTSKALLFDISQTHASFILSDIWRYRGLILGSCTYNTKIFPPMGALLDLLENNNLQNHLLGVFGSCSWGGGALAALREFSGTGSWKLIEPSVEARCAPTEEVLGRCYELGKNLAQALAS